MRKFYYSILIAIACVTGLLSSCNKDGEFIDDGTGITVNGDMATLTFRVEDALPEQTYTRAPFLCDTVIQKLNDSLMIETVIAPDYGVTTRGMSAVTNTTILTVAYSVTRGEMYKRELSLVTDGKFAIHLPAGETYHLYFLAENGKNNATWTDFDGYFTGTWTAGGDGDSSMLAVSGATTSNKDGETPRDLMQGTISGLIVSEGTQLPAIAMKHLFCKAKLTLTSTAGSNPTAWTAVLGPTFPKANSVNLMNGSWAGAGTKQDITLTNSNEQILIPQTTDNITLKYSSVTIDGTVYTSSKTSTLAYKFVPGTKYSITGRVSKPQNPKTVTFVPDAGCLLEINSSEFTSTAKVVTIKTGETVSVLAKPINGNYVFNKWSCDNGQLPTGTDDCITLSYEDAVDGATYQATSLPVETYDMYLWSKDYNEFTVDPAEVVDYHYPTPWPLYWNGTMWNQVMNAGFYYNPNEKVHYRSTDGTWESSGMFYFIRWELVWDEEEKYINEITSLEWDEDIVDDPRYIAVPAMHEGDGTCFFAYNSFEPGLTWSSYYHPLVINLKQYQTQAGGLLSVEKGKAVATLWVQPAWNNAKDKRYTFSNVRFARPIY